MGKNKEIYGIKCYCIMFLTALEQATELQYIRLNYR